MTISANTRWIYRITAIVLAGVAIIWLVAGDDPALEHAGKVAVTPAENQNHSVAETHRPVVDPQTESAAVASDTGAGAVLNRQAMNAWMDGDVRGALSLFEQAIAAAPDDPAPHSNYGRLLTSMVSYERAVLLLEHARDLEPHDAQVWLDLATVYERAQLLDKSWAARAEAEKLVGAAAISRDEQGRFVVDGQSLWN